MKWLNEKQCNVDDCLGKHEARGYCKRHYKSFMKYGDAYQVDRNKEERLKKQSERELLKSRNKDITARGTVRKVFSREGVCSVDGCNEPIKSKRLCEKHYTRQRRNGTTESLFKIVEIDVENCLVIGCERKHFRGGYCSTHYGYNVKLRTPYIAKTIKLCGVEGCENKHLARGLCRKHYNEWSSILKKNKLDWWKEK